MAQTEVTPAAEEQSRITQDYVVEGNGKPPLNGVPSPNGVKTVDVERQLTFDEVTANVQSEIGRLTGVAIKIETAKTLAKEDAKVKGDIQRIQLFFVHLGRELLKDPETQNIVLGKQAVGFKNIIRRSKDSTIDHKDITERMKVRPQDCPEDSTPEDLVGVGGFGHVYKVKEIHGAGKVLRPSGNNDATMAEFRFQREARAMEIAAAVKRAQLLLIAKERKSLDKDYKELSTKQLKTQRRNRRAREQKPAFAPQLISQGHIQHDTEQFIPTADSQNREKYILMEWVDGETLANVLKRRKKLPLDEAARMISQVLSSVSEAHQAGLVHRDMKPENIIIQPATKKRPEQVQVLDWGLSRLIDTDEAIDDYEKTRTSEGAILGTPLYMSPDQADGSKEPKVDAYSLAVMFVEAVTGKNPRKNAKLGSAIETATYLQKEKENPSMLLKELQPYGVDAVEAARCLMIGDAEKASSLLNDLAEGRRGPLLRRGIVKLKHAGQRLKQLSKAQMAALVAFIFALIGGGGTYLSLKHFGTGNQHSEVQEDDSHLLTFVRNQRGIPEMQLGMPVLGPDNEKMLEHFHIPTGVAFYRGKGADKRLFAIVGAYSGPDRAKFERRNLATVPRVHMKQRRLIAFFDEVPGKDDVTFATSNDGHQFVIDGRKITAYPAPNILSDSLHLREVPEKRRKTIGQHYVDPAYVRLLWNLPEKPDEVEIIDVEMFKGTKDEPLGDKAESWSGFLQKEMLRLKDTFEKQRRKNGQQEKAFLAPDLRDQFTTRAALALQAYGHQKGITKQPYRDNRRDRS